MKATPLGVWLSVKNVQNLLKWLTSVSNAVALWNLKQD
jgi:hypothetical protein